MIKELGMEYLDEIKGLYADIFMNKPWNDDWSDEARLQQYIQDLIGNSNSLTIGLFENDMLIGLSMGSILHWYSGIEYYIFEFCIKREKQGQGMGTVFLEQIEEYVKRKQVSHIVLQTERNVPAFKFYRKNGFVELEDSVSLYKAF